MTMYERTSRLSLYKQRRLLEHFVAGTTARAAAELVGVNRNTAADYFLRLRKLIASKLPSYELSGEVEADESYFGGARKGKRGRGAAGKVAVFGLLKRGGKVYTAIIPNAKTETLLPIIQEKVQPDSIVYTDTFSAYNALDVSGFDFLRPIQTNLSESQLLRWGRGVSILIGCIATLGAGFVSHLGNIFDIAQKLYGVFMGPLLALMLMTLSRWRPPTWSILGGAIVGCAIGIVVVWSPVASLWTATTAFLGTFIVPVAQHIMRRGLRRSSNE